MEMRHLHVFLATAETLHFSKAALRLRVAQSALSRTIRDLETELGLPLFKRSTHQVSLTEAGKDFLAYSRRILAETSEAVHSARRIARGEKGVLRIGFIGSLSYEVLPRLLRDFRARQPGVVLSLHEAGPQRQKEMIRAGMLDCGFFGLPHKDDTVEFEVRVVFEEELVAAVPETHPFAKKPSLRLTDLKSEPLYLTARENAPAFNPWIISLCQKAGFEPQIIQEVDRSATVLCMVGAGLGLSIFPRQVSRNATLGVRFVDLRPKTHRYRYTLGWLRGEQRPHLKEFVNFVAQESLR